MQPTPLRPRRLAAAVALATALLALLVPGAPAHAAVSPPPGVADLLPAVPPPGANDWSCRPTAAHPRPVVLVHGTFEGAFDNWAGVAPQIRAAGYCVFALDYGNRGTGDIPTSAGQLARFVDAVLAPGPRTANVLIQDHCPADPVDHTQIHDDPVVLRWTLQALGRPGPADPTHPPSCV